MNDNHLGACLHFRGEIIRYLIQKGYRVSLIAPTNGETFEGIDGLNIVPIKLNRTSTSIKSYLSYLKSLWGEIHSLEPDVVINYTIIPIVFGGIASYLNRIPSISFFAGLNHQIRNLLENKKVSLFPLKGLLKGILRKNKTNIFLNQDDQDFMINHGILMEGKTFLLNGGEGVNTDFYVPAAFEKRSSQRLKVVMVSHLFYILRK